ncbi:hypothetical protein C7974DRAFT_218842 [Boeremia exigua]|uniref:uncharacterized protein n=1 Tax=Boeremia exigua TaxID=749465 RepID=UPI001E8D1885|nr:uncharacterized protein C7974DRAFT_218842 [Boeremia exigua]KAH6622240.1 hypothetical protein C7974DRAFT_218842 [Boeremia exigua]
MVSFDPTLLDAETALAILASLRLPNEIALCILDQAQYWIKDEYNCEEHTLLIDGAWSLDYSAVYPYLCVRAYPQLQGRHLQLREITFTIVSHDQGWTTEDTQGTYQTSSWFEVSIIRPNMASSDLLEPGLRLLRDMNIRGDIVDGVKVAFDIIHSDGRFELVRRPSSDFEPQRVHCTEMMQVNSQGEKEGEYAWYLQGNEVARKKSVFEGEMIKRYRVTWGCKHNPVQVTNEGAGSGDGFIDSIEKDDYICVWARAKRRGWENQIYGVRMVMRYMI